MGRYEGRRDGVQSGAAGEFDDLTWSFVSKIDGFPLTIETRDCICTSMYMKGDNHIRNIFPA